MFKVLNYIKKGSVIFPKQEKQETVVIIKSTRLANNIISTVIYMFIVPAMRLIYDKIYNMTKFLLDWLKDNSQ